jgi:hypothetical protein
VSKVRPSKPPPHPDPPADLFSRDLPIRPISTDWFRIHKIDNDPIFFGKTADNRFDDPQSEFGVLYLGEDASCAFIEVFGHATGIKFVTSQELGQRALARIAAQKPLSLVDLTANGLAQLGADARLCDGDYRVSQRWSRGFWSHPSGPDGILYRSRHDPAKTCAALIDRIIGQVHAATTSPLLSPENEALLSDILDHYGFGKIL